VERQQFKNGMMNFRINRGWLHGAKKNYRNKSNQAKLCFGQLLGILMGNSKTVSTELLRRLMDTDSFSPELFRSACNKFNVREVVVQGEYGQMQGSAVDPFVMPEYMKRGTYDWERIQFLRTQLRSGGLFLDIGANVGMYTVALAANPAVQCIAFEPEPNNFWMLRSNVARNCSHGNVLCHQIALMEAPGEVTFELAPENTGDHRVRLPSAAQSLQGETSRKTIKVFADRLDNKLVGVELKNPLVAKIDVQGAELTVLRSADAILKSIDLMVLEFWPYGLQRMGSGADTLLDILRSHFPFACYAPWGKGLPSELVPFEFTARKARGLNPNNPDDFADLILTRHQQQSLKIA
jgi:FkbM family methyltransferase